MRRSLYVKFVVAYVLVAILGFLLISTVGSRMIEKQLVRETGGDLYREASAVAESHGTLYYGSQTSIESLYSNLSVLASYQDSTIWLVNAGNRLLLSTDEPLDAEDAPLLEDFDPAVLGNSYYTIGAFDAYFSEKMLSVLAPITQNMSIRGYIVIHTPMSQIYLHREEVNKEEPVMRIRYPAVPADSADVYLHRVPSSETDHPGSGRVRLRPPGL